MPWAWGLGLLWMSACAAKPFNPKSEFDRGQYEIIHGQAYLCIQPDADRPWKFRCKHAKTGEIIEMDRIQVSTQADESSR